MKTIYLAWVFHGNMSYDRYTKHHIRQQFPLAYQVMINEFIQYPALKGHVELSGLSVESLRRWAPDTITQLHKLAERGQVTFCASYFAAPVNACMDGNSHMDALSLGTQIVQATCGPIDGLFTQEQSYTPQLPWAMNQLGIQWVSMPAPAGITQPFVLRGFDGSTVYGVPIAQVPWRNLAEKMRDAPDNSLYLYVGDYEMYRRLSPILDLARTLEPEGIRLQITLVSDYLRKFPPVEEVSMETCRFPEPIEAPHYSRWCSDPQDIRLHEITMQAANDMRDARILTGLVRRQWGYEADTTVTLNELAPDMRTLNIEQPEEFTSVVEHYIAGDGQHVTKLDLASYLISWGTNSDARGWYPLKERRLEHEHALRSSSHWSRRCIQDALSFIGRGIPRRGNGIPILLYNGGPAREAWCRFKCESPYGVANAAGEPLPCQVVWETDGCVVWARVSLPSYGYTVVYLTETGAPESSKWSVGTRITGAHGTLEYINGGVRLHWCGRNYSVGYTLPSNIRELTQSEGLLERALEAPRKAEVYVRDGKCPELMLYHELAFGMHLIQRYTLEDDMVRCHWTFDCSRPFLLGEKDYFRPDGLAAVIQTQPGKVFYDAGYSVLEHENTKAGYFVALQFAGVQAANGGLVAASSTGTQSFWFDPTSGELRLGLGASTVGGPATNPDTMTVDIEKGRITHFNTWDEEIFYGTYEHEFCLFTFDGAWQKQPVTHRALAVNTPVRMRRLCPARDGISGMIGTGNLPPEQSLLQLDAHSVHVQSATWDEGRLVLLLNEMQGKATECKLRAAGQDLAVDLHAGALKHITV